MKISRFLRNTVLYILLFSVTVYLILPFLWTFSSSIKPGRELYIHIPSWIPQSPDFSRYIGIFTGREELMPSPGQVVAGETLRSFKYGMLNSLIVSGSVTFICLFVGSFAAYSFAKLKFRGKNALFSLIMILRLIPVVALVIPLYLILQSFNLIDTKFGLILVYASFTLPLVFLIMKAFFETIPPELEDAARLDGCSDLGVLFRVILPLSTPGLVAAGLLAFIMAYQEFLFALVCTTSLNSKTIPTIMAEFFGRHGMDYGMLSTGAILGVIPPLIIALIAQKYIVEGLIIGAVKG